MKTVLQRVGVALNRSGSEEGSIPPAVRTSPGKQSSSVGTAEKILAFICKVLKIVIVYVCSETDSSVVPDLLICCRAVLCELPLAPIASANRPSVVMVIADVEVLVSRLVQALLTRSLDSKHVPIPVIPAKDSERINGLLGTSSSKINTISSELEKNNFI